MKILHYIENFSQNDLLSDHLSLLVSEESNYVDASLIKNKNELLKQLRNEAPDIVHFHNCWSRKTYRCIRIAKSEGCFTILSPHWELNRINRCERKLTKSIMAIAFQKNAIKMVDALLVTGNDELEEIIKLGWKTRIDSVPSHLLKHEISPEAMAQETITFYRKVMDTGYRRRMNKAEFNCLNSLLHIGLLENGMLRNMPNEHLIELRKLNPQQWQRILLFSDDEDIREMINKGIEKLQLSVPDIDTNNILRYLPLITKQAGSLDKENLFATDVFTRNKTENVIEDADSELKTGTIMFLNAKYLLNKNKFTLHHLADIYKFLKTCDYDEVKLSSLLKKMHIYKFARRILQILSNYLFLEEGFMPFKPLDDKKTTKLEQTIINIDKY